MSAKLMNRGGLTSSFRNNGERGSYLGNNEEIQDNDTNDIIKLQLKKPKAWNWELSTSKSSPNIAFPRIMLYNEKGKLLADAQEADCVFRGPAADCQRTQSTKTTRSSSTVRQDTKNSGTGESNRNTPTPSLLSASSSTRSKKRRSSTTNLPEINECLDDLVDQLESKGINYKLRQYTVPSGMGLGRMSSGSRKLKRQISSPSLFATAEEEIEENCEKGDKLRGNDANGTRGESKISNINNERAEFEKPFPSINDVPEIPIYVFSEKGLLQRDLNAKEFNHLRKPYERSKTTNLENIQVSDKAFTPCKQKQIKSQESGKSLLKPNKSFTPVKEVHFDLHKSKSAIDVGEVRREKKLCRRTNSSGPSKFSGSILERMSAFKRRSSSTDSQDVEFTIVEHGPRYFLRTSNAGTLVVCEESFRDRRVRRRPKSCSRISEYDEPKTSPIGKERIIQEYAYLSNSRNYHSFEEPYYYDEAIARIDKLISKVSLERDPGENVTRYRSAGDVRSKNKNELMGSRVVSAPAVNRRGISNSSLLTVGNGLDREQSFGSGTKVKRKKKKLRRCLSANTVLLKDSSSDEERLQSRERASRGRSRGRTKSRDELRRRTVQLDGLNENTENGDQILTLNNSNISAVQSIGSSADIIEEPSDEVLLRLVQRLASIKQSQKDTSLNITENPETPNDISDASTIEEDENRNYRSQSINIADCEDFESNNNPSAVHRQATLLSHELLIEEDSPHVVHREDSEDESSDASNEYISYTIESVNDLNGNSSQQSKEHSPYTFVTNNIKEEEDEEDECNGNFVECNENEFVDPNEQETTNEDNLLVDDSNMGSNVSRNSGKGLTGRRTQSSDCTFPVKITKGPRGLGLSISGGVDSNAPFPGLIRIKRLFPHQAAWSTGQLQPGDIILEVNGISLTGLTNYEALEVLRTMPNDVVLLICRPNDEQYQKLSPPTEPPKPPQRTQQQGTQTTLDDEIYPLQPLTPLQTNFTGEFEIIMVKQQGSLGFTLRKEDESVLGHYVRALVREPATTDGRIKPGDKIVAVNDVPLSAMTHEQAVIFLRQAADTVKLRLYRDEAQTPVAAMSPTNSESKTICGTLKKTFLRPEAINLLSDLAYKKQSPSANSTESSIKSTNSSPRRLKRGTKANSSEVNSQSEQDTTDSKSSSNPQYLVSSQTTSVCSDSEQSIASQCTYIVQPADTSGGIDNELFKMQSEEDRPDRPSFLDLTGQSGSTPMVPRKPRFQFSVAANAYELNNLDNDALDAPIYTGNTTMTLDTTAGSSTTGDQQLPSLHEFTSLPCETFLIACKTESDLKNEAEFNHKNALHQSFHIQQNDDPDQAGTKKDGNKSLLKWKGVVFSPEDEGEQKKLPSETDSSCAATAGTNPTPATERDFDLKDFPSNGNGHKVITVELNRGWNSRLGFSLQPHPETLKTFISAIYNDSVAARDGRLRVGDQLLTVNDESVESMPTSEIIDLMRIIRGSIVITVLRKDDPH